MAGGSHPDCTQVYSHASEISYGDTNLRLMRLDDLVLVSY